MKLVARLALPLVLLAAAQVRDVAGNRLVALTVVKGPAWFAAKDGERSALRCAADRRLCVRVVHEGQDWTLELYDHLPAAPNPTTRIAIVTDGQISFVALWPNAVRQADGHVLVGAQVTQSTYYSGGGASNTALTLYDVMGGTAEPQAVLDVSIGGSAMIRACSSELDRRMRAGACHDQYDFTGTLTLDPVTRAGHPRFRLTTIARTFPGAYRARPIIWPSG